MIGRQNAGLNNPVTGNREDGPVIPENAERRFNKGNVCRHHSGRVYTIVAFANEAHPSEKFPLAVVYMGANGETWTRSYDEFAQKFDILFDGTNLAE